MVFGRNAPVCTVGDETDLKHLLQIQILQLSLSNDCHVDLSLSLNVFLFFFLVSMLEVILKKFYLKMMTVFITKSKLLLPLQTWTAECELLFWRIMRVSLNNLF